MEFFDGIQFPELLGVSANFLETEPIQSYLKRTYTQLQAIHAFRYAI